MMKNESGRSMVEMLGVLAIIGVLSVGGIAGYTMAMNKYRANEAIAYGSQCLILARAANMGAGTTDTSVCSSLVPPNTQTSISSVDADQSPATIVIATGSADVCSAAASTGNNVTCNNQDITITIS